MENCFYKVALCCLIGVLFSYSVKAQVSAVVNPQNTTCGLNNGSATVTPSNGSGYTYQWSSGGSNTNTVTGLPSGNYTVTVYSTPISDSIVKSFTISASVALQATLVSDTMPTCGKRNGSILCSTNDSHALNTFVLNGTIIQQGGGTEIIHSADTGTYTFYAVDSTTGCSDTIHNIILPDNSSYPVFTSVVPTPATCFGNNNGTITVTLGNCGGGCTYRWSYSAANTTTSATGLPAGKDTFYVSNAGCTNLDTIITVPGPLARLMDTLRTHADHCGKDTGSAIVLTGGGTGPYTYNWSMGTPLGDSVTQLPGDSNIYVTVTDSHGCADTLKAFVGSSPRPAANISRSDTICVFETNGILIVTPTSADGPFTYQWSNGQSSNVNAGIGAGNYAVTVYDAVGCDTVLHSVVPAYSVQNSFTTTPSGTITPGQTVEIQILTNVPVKNVVWEPYIPGSSGNTVVGFKPEQSARYTVTVTYGLACQFVDTIPINVLIDSFGMFSIPNTFTPNGDGLNDFFKLISYPQLSNFHIWIFDRWGNKVFESTDMDFRWDGNDQYAGNKALNTGVYSYVVQYETYSSDGKKTVGGNISLIK